MPTRDRPAFVVRAIEYFLRQDYARCELLIVDGGSHPVRALVPDGARIRYIQVQRGTTIGAARNIACLAAEGEVIAHWDDDDWHAPDRVRYQVETLLGEGLDLCGMNPVIFYDCLDHSAWRYEYPATERFWVHGNGWCYRRSLWERTRFSDVDVGEDTRFLWSLAGGRMRAVPDSTRHISILHGGNVSACHARGAFWHPHDPSKVREILGSDWPFYAAPAMAECASDAQARLHT